MVAHCGSSILYNFFDTHLVRLNVVIQCNSPPFLTSRSACVHTTQAIRFGDSMLTIVFYICQENPTFVQLGILVAPISLNYEYNDLHRMLTNS